MNFSRFLLPFVFLGLIVLLFFEPVWAFTSQDVIITATPSFLGISVSPDTWIINGIKGSGKIRTNTTYYSNPLGDVVSPSITVLDSECRFTLVNGSTMPIDVVLDIADFIGGDFSTNSNLGTNGLTSFGAYTYVSGDLFVNKVKATSFMSPTLISSLPVGINKKFGIEITTQTHAWTSKVPSSVIATIIVSAH